jgi:hypothetical protein
MMLWYLLGPTKLMFNAFSSALLIPFKILDPG